MANEKYAPVSVIVPCFRCAATIERAVSSIAQQTYLPTEVILIDDASGDQTWDVMCKMRAIYPDWIKVIQLEENNGAAVARNRGMATTTQPYIAFLDSDDAWHPRKIEIQYTFMDANPDVVLCGHEHRQLNPCDPLPDWPVGECFATRIHKWMMLLSNRFVTPSVMIRRDTNQFFVDKQRHMEDHMLWLNIIYQGGRVIKLSPEMAAIYKKPFGVSGLSSQMWLMERSELGNYHRLYRSKSINVIQFGLLIAYSLLKYVRRLMSSCLSNFCKVRA